MKSTHASSVLLVAMAVMGALVGASKAGSSQSNFDATAPVSIAALRDLASHSSVAAVLTAKGRAVLMDPDTVTLYSIEPDTWRGYGYGKHTNPSPQEHALKALHGGKGVLGSLAINDRGLRRAVLKGLYQGFIHADGHMLCYEPRHALVYRAGYDSVIVCVCFECFYAVVLERDTRVGRYQEFGDMVGVFWKGAPYPFMRTVNALLKEAGIPLAK